MPLQLQNLVNPLRVDETGTVRIGKTRVPLETIIVKFLLGDSAEELADAFSLPLADVYATISYYLQHRAEVDAYLKDVEAQEARVLQMVHERLDHGALRQKLLARAAASSRAG
jgi:uncharacterized protein (DUF433 family)